MLVQGRDFYLCCLTELPFLQTEMPLTAHKGWDVTPAASTPAWFGPTMLVDGYLMAVMSGRVAMWKPFPIPLVPPGPMKAPGGCSGDTGSVSSHNN